MSNRPECVLCEDEFGRICQVAEKVLKRKPGAVVSYTIPMANLNVAARGGQFDEGVYIAIKNALSLEDENLKAKVKNSLTNALVGILQSRGFHKNGGPMRYVRGDNHIVLNVSVATFAIYISIKKPAPSS